MRPALGAPLPLWLAGEGNEPSLVSEAYRMTGSNERLTTFGGEASQTETAAIEWLRK